MLAFLGGKVPRGRFLDKQAGMTLIELVVIVAVIGIILTVSLFFFRFN
jgi:prepilin-type N-terminal cleavage/methylation domain-containing protein